MSNQENLGKSIKEIFQDKYVIPLYQRNYAWREEEIVQLLQDIYVTFKNKQAHYYIGSLVVLKRHNGTFEVIDGQQRLTTLSLIVRLLECYQHSVLSYDSRPAVEDFFDAFYKNPDSIDAHSSPEIFYLKEAIHTIKETAISNGQEQVRLSSWEDKNTFADFLMNNVFLVRVEIPEDTDVASYFEIMNNRGEQLQKHEIVKALMMKKLELHQQKTFAKIWDTCSQMNVPIQKMFSDVEERKKIFGENYDSFMGIEKLSDNNSQVSEQSELTIDEILGKDNISAGIESNFSIEDSDKYHSIIDWSNFLMHILKLHDEKNVQLNEKFLLDDYNELASKQAFEPWDFIKTLLYCRTVFDRFVVKQEYDPEKEDGFSWTLIKPKKHNNSQLDYESSFSVKDEPDNLIKALSMLQVSFRSRTYKNWLFELLKWFYIEKKMIRPDAVNASDLLSFLNYYIWNRYSDMKLTFQKAEQPINDKDSWKGTYCEGTRTPHFLFNFIDYLYWLKKDKTEDFDFKYWNSVEHHLAQNKAANIEGAEQYIDNLGNLCLISKSSNSRLSDRVVQEKVDFYGSGNIGPKRQRMYAKTQDESYTWGQQQICAHYNEVCVLLNDAEEILGVKKPSTSEE